MRNYLELAWRLCG